MQPIMIPIQSPTVMWHNYVRARLQNLLWSHSTWESCRYPHVHRNLTLKRLSLPGWGSGMSGQAQANQLVAVELL
eukprot:3653018-Amphidinium_carterae.1